MRMVKVEFSKSNFINNYTFNEKIKEAWNMYEQTKDVNLLLRENVFTEKQKIKLEEICEDLKFEQLTEKHLENKNIETPYFWSGNKEEEKEWNDSKKVDLYIVEDRFNKTIVDLDLLLNLQCVIPQINFKVICVYKDSGSITETLIDKVDRIIK